MSIPPIPFKNKTTFNIILCPRCTQKKVGVAPCPNCGYEHPPEEVTSYRAANPPPPPVKRKKPQGEARKPNFRGPGIALPGSTLNQPTKTKRGK